jgi:hypothetical protein
MGHVEVNTAGAKRVAIRQFHISYVHSLGAIGEQGIDRVE